jgi:hypothetical protein
MRLALEGSWQSLHPIVIDETTSRCRHKGGHEYSVAGGGTCGIVGALAEVIMRGRGWMLTVSATAALAATLGAARAAAQAPAGAPPLAPQVQVAPQQNPPAARGTIQSQGAGSGQTYYAQDGGTSEVLESIVIPPKAKAPFSLLLQTEWVKTLYDGGTITSVNERRIARDSAGRIYQERWFLVPKNGKYKSEMTTIQISDPNTHTLYNCFMLNKKNQCILSTYSPSVNAVYKFQGPPTGPLADDVGNAIHEDLGKQFVAGVETEGTRDSVIYNPNVFGNDRKVTIEREYWYSAALGINLLSKRSDPRIGTQTFTATQLILSEPDPKLFDLPEGFKVVDHRDTAPAEN